MKEELQVGDYKLSGLSGINVLLGKNGCGKSTVLRALDGSLRANGYVRYISPERGGNLTFDGNVDTNISNNEEWVGNTRRKNQADNFRQVSVSEFRRLETLVLRKIEQDVATRNDHTFSFDKTIASINTLLDNVQIKRDETVGFSTRSAATSDSIKAGNLSSGESELISLSIEILSFAYVVQLPKYKDTTNLLLIDEPDVHLHPDLQYRLIRLMIDAVAGGNLQILMATHSTAIVGALADQSEARVAFMTAGQRQLPFEPIGKATQAILPIFGAHPLSNIFSKKPLLLVEGEDDQRIWEQAVRSSGGKIRLWPCPAGDKQSLAEFEQTANALISAVYDSAVALSLRDRDDSAYPIQDIGSVARARLNCRTAENLLLTDDLLAAMGSSWPQLQSTLDQWISANGSHPQHEAAAQFRTSGYNRKESDVKELRNLFMMLLGSNKPWEVAVGQSIARINFGSPTVTPFATPDFLGPKLLEMIKDRAWS